MVAPIDRWNRKRRGRTRPAPGLNVHGAQGAALQKVANETMRYRPDCRGVKAFFYSWITAVAGASARSVAPMPWLSIDSSRAGAMLSWASSTLQRASLARSS